MINLVKNFRFWRQYFADVVVKALQIAEIQANLKY